MGFLSKIAAAKDDMYIAIDDIYESDPQYQQLLKFSTDLLYKFAKRFRLSDEKMLEMYVKHLKKDF